jgi:putative transposase
LPALRRAGRAVARKRKGGRNRRKVPRRLRSIHARVRTLRREHHHQVALKLVRRFGLIAVERLNVRGMLKNDRLARAISDAGRSGFFLTLRHHAAKAGAAFVDVDPGGTSQRCGRCGQAVGKDLSVRWPNCPNCRLSIHRDHNSA